jgi:hypothetical protein
MKISKKDLEGGKLWKKDMSISLIISPLK